jgi:hypothetical protein
MNNKCVYFHYTLDTNEIFYVGVGNANRPYSKKSRNDFWQHIVNTQGYTIEIIHINLSLNDAYDLEVKYINLYGRKDLGLGTLINLGNGGKCNNNLSKHVRDKISESLKGVKKDPRSKEYCDNISKSKIGIKNPMYGKISNRAKTVIQLSLNGDCIQEFIGLYRAANEINGSPQHIASCCRGERNTHKKFKWKYKIEDNEINKST